MSSKHGEGYHFYFDMPGIKADSVNVQVEDGRLMVEAERKQPERAKDVEVHLTERITARCAARSRCLTMPAHDGNKATYRDGVLEVTVAKKPESQADRIKVNVEN